jgi:hypothetical protein
MVKIALLSATLALATVSRASVVGNNLFGAKALEQ